MQGEISGGFLSKNYSKHNFPISACKIHLSKDNRWTSRFCPLLALLENDVVQGGPTDLIWASLRRRNDLQKVSKLYKDIYIYHIYSWRIQVEKRYKVVIFGLPLGLEDTINLWNWTTACNCLYNFNILKLKNSWWNCWSIELFSFVFMLSRLHVLAILA